MSQPVVHTLQAQKACPENNQPFLSVVMRTQGQRVEELREALLCLSAQSNFDFELLLLGHALSPQQKQGVLSLVGETPEFFRSHVFYHDVAKGGRATPLNYGFSAARGKYIAVFDDDDLVFPNWVEAFYTAAGQYPGKILHAYSLRQNWCKTEEGTLFAIQPAQPAYCTNFYYPLQLAENQCPFMSLAFPATLYHKDSFRFSERLEVMEDWDFLMSTALVAGVADIPIPTSVYRIWETGETSRSLHSQNQWKQQYHAIVARLAQSPILLEKGDALLLAQHYQYALASGLLAPQQQNTSQFYYSVNNTFSEQESQLGINQLSSPDFQVRFPLPASAVPYSSFRFDPAPTGEICIEDFTLCFFTEAGEKILIENPAISHNGVQVGNQYCFLLEDPQMIFTPPRGEKLAAVEVSGKLHRPIPLALRQQVYAQLLSPTSEKSKKYSFFTRLWRHLGKES